MAPMVIIPRMDYAKSLLNVTVAKEELFSSANVRPLYALEINVRRWNDLFYKKSYRYYITLVKSQ